MLSTTIDKYCYISCRKIPPFFEHKHRIVYSNVENVREIDEIQHPSVKAVLKWAQIEEGLEIHHDADLPARSGLGSSSAFTVGLAHAMYSLRGQMVSKNTLAEDAIHLEQNLIGEAVGSQDQISAAYGGFNRIDFNPDETFSVAPISIDASRLGDLQNHLLLFFTGFSRFASDIESSKLVNFSQKSDSLKRMMDMVIEAEDLLKNNNRDLQQFGWMLQEAWEYKKSLSSNVSTSAIDEIYSRAIAAGALGGKILGAGGGGFILFFVPPEKQSAVRSSLAELIEVPFLFEQEGCSVVLG